MCELALGGLSRDSAGACLSLGSLVLGGPTGVMFFFQPEVVEVGVVGVGALGTGGVVMQHAFLHNTDVHILQHIPELRALLQVNQHNFLLQPRKVFWIS